MRWLGFALLGTAVGIFGGCAKEPDLPQQPIDDNDGGTGQDEVGETGEPECPPCEHPVMSCDEVASDVFLALGAGCDDRPVIDPIVFANTLAVRSVAQVGTSNEYLPREGSKLVVMGSGFIDNFLDGDYDCAGIGTGDDLGQLYSLGMELPAPIEPSNVGASDCFDDPSLVGMGDCSNTLQLQWDAGGATYGIGDYSELRFKAVVPDDANSVKFDLAFFTSEYPEYENSTFNDMFIGWLESELWTGNVSFDHNGHPISVNAGFLDFKDNAGTLAEMKGTCMVGHGATRWLTSTALVKEGETIELVFAIFDVRDHDFDSFVALDNFRWGCDGCAPPDTSPETGDETDTGD
jgi:hypothetical protein